MTLFEPGQVTGDVLFVSRTHPNHLRGRNEPLPEDAVTRSFRDTLIGSLEDVNQYQVEHEQLSVQALVNPGSVEAHDLTIAAARASTSLSITRNIVDRVIQAYRDITNLR